MGMSADAGICFGIDCGEDMPFEDSDGDTDLGTYLADKAGLVSPYTDEINHMPYPHFKEWKAAHPEFKKAADDYYNAKRDLEDKAPVEIVSYNHYEYPLYVVALKGTQIRQSYEAKEFDPNILDKPNQAEFERAIEFCEVNNLPDFSKATWLLYANYG